MPNPDGFVARIPSYMEAFYEQRQRFIDEVMKQHAEQNDVEIVSENRPPN